MKKLIKFLTLLTLLVISLTGCWKALTIPVVCNFMYLQSMNSDYEGFIACISDITFVEVNNGFGYSFSGNSLNVNIFENQDDYNAHNAYKSFQLDIMSSTKNFPESVTCQAEDGTKVYFPKAIKSTLGHLVSPYVKFSNFLGTNDEVYFANSESDNIMDFIDPEESEFASFFLDDETTFLHSQVINPRKNFADYSGPKPYKDATVNKCYYFNTWIKFADKKYKPVFDEVNATTQLNYELSQDKTHYVVSAKSVSATANLTTRIGEFDQL